MLFISVNCATARNCSCRLITINGVQCYFCEIRVGITTKKATFVFGPSQRKMDLFVVGLDGSTFTVRCSESTVEEVQQQVEEEQGVPPPLQHLLFQGRELEPGRPLEHYNVQHGSTIHLTMDLEGGYIVRHERVLAEWHVLTKQICRKCYGRVSAAAKRCPKAKCGRTTDLRPKKTLYKYSAIIKEFQSYYGDNLRLHTHIQ